MKEQDFQIRVIRYLAGEMSAKESDHLLESLTTSAERQKFFEEYERIWNNMGTVPDPPNPSIEEQWQIFATSAFEKPATIRKLPLWSRPLFRIAAMIAILATSLITWSILTQDLSGGAGLIVIQTGAEMEELTLPDGSKVWLDKHSKLEYQKDFQPRSVILEGQGLFEVQHLSSDETFSVEAGKTRTTVLGTIFMVNSGTDEEATTVYVQEGKVAVSGVSKSVGAAILTAGEQAVYDEKSNEVSKLTAANLNVLSWKTGVFSFDDTPLAEILPSLEMHYGVQFEIINSGLLACTYNSDFANMNLEEMLEELSFGLNLRIIKSTEGVYEVDGTPCK
ncbi:MAG: FecR domain-containing protein [Saprospiraceae bacterium]|nr:FecR domain-containing protein [Saprospiraceae bacterium]